MRSVEARLVPASRTSGSRHDGVRLPGGPGTSLRPVRHGARCRSGCPFPRARSPEGRGPVECAQRGIGLPSHTPPCASCRSPHASAHDRPRRGRSADAYVTGSRRRLSLTLMLVYRAPPSWPTLVGSMKPVTARMVTALLIGWSVRGPAVHRESACWRRPQGSRKRPNRGWRARTGKTTISRPDNSGAARAGSRLRGRSRTARRRRRDGRVAAHP